ncbi:MAG: hypothetical protein E7379_02585 [Clostridiales bacterium]|nr:hypothetical protein [Clostridiales bacterium]
MNYYEIGFVCNKEKHEYYFVMNGQESERFYEASFYQDGFAKVRKTKDSELQYIDLLGRITNEKTKSGEQFFQYILGEIPYESLFLDHFSDNLFCIGVKQQILQKAKTLAKERYNSGIPVNKKDFEKAIEKTFKEIDLKHSLALEIAQSNAEIDEIYKNKNSGEDEYEDTMTFLDGFAL